MRDKKITSQKLATATLLTQKFRYYTSFLLVGLLGFNCPPNGSGNTYSYSFQEIWELLGGEISLLFFGRFFRPRAQTTMAWSLVRAKIRPTFWCGLWALARVSNHRWWPIRLPYYHRFRRRMTSQRGEVQEGRDSRADLEKIPGGQMSPWVGQWGSRPFCGQCLSSRLLLRGKGIWRT